MNRQKLIPLLWGLALCVSPYLPLLAQPKRAVTPKDCATMREFTYDQASWRSTVRISPDGGRVAYLVKTPKLETNTNDIELLVANLAGPAAASRNLLSGDLSSVQWLKDSRHLAILARQKGKQVLMLVDAISGEQREIVEAASDIEEYSIDSNGEAVAFSTEVPTQDLESKRTRKELASGYRIPYEIPQQMIWPRRRLFVCRKTKSGWSSPHPVRIESPFSHQRLDSLAYQDSLYLALSPDGSQLLLRYIDATTHLPEAWRRSPKVRQAFVAGFPGQPVLVDYHPGTGKTTFPAELAWTYNTPLWGADSQSFVVSGHSPVGSEEEKEDIQKHLAEHSSGAHLFWVEPAGGQVQKVAETLAFPWDQPLAWTKDGGLLVETGSRNRLALFSRREGRWAERREFVLARRVGSQSASDGRVVVTTYSDTETPPELILFRLGDTGIRTLARLDPQFDAFRLASPQKIHWTTSAGYQVTGLLLLPPDYVEGKRYPMVIQTKPFTNSFVCGFGIFPSFAPLPLADAGILYLGRIPGDEPRAQREEDFYPKGYPGLQGPGGVAEAAFQMDVWDSAVKALAAEGIVDPNRIGVIGYSRTGWYTEFLLSHSKIRYRAATLADNVHYSLGEYWLYRDQGMREASESVYGGPPYGAGLKNWLDYSISFNLDKIRTPILMENMGNGIVWSNPKTPPLTLGADFEIFTGLRRLGKPVELYYYPDEGHQPDHPQARLATLQRNLDWYRFWLEGYERPQPEDSEQYLRWRELLEQLELERK